jgi:hypothetical protein
VWTMTKGQSTHKQLSFYFSSNCEKNWCIHILVRTQLVAMHTLYCDVHTSIDACPVHTRMQVDRSCGKVALWPTRVGRFKLLGGRVVLLSRGFEKNSEKPLFLACKAAGKWSGFVASMSWRIQIASGPHASTFPQLRKNSEKPLLQAVGKWPCGRRAVFLNPCGHGHFNGRW